MKESYLHTPTGGRGLASGESQKYLETLRKLRFSMRESYLHTPTGGGGLATGESQKYWKTKGK